MIYEIKNKNLLIKVDSKGCQMVNALYKNKERLWQNDNGTWAKHSPLLFPYAGRCSMIVDGVTYRYTQHGFARDLEWELVELLDDSITMKLTSSSRSKEQYPYDFVFYTTYKLEGNTVKIAQTLENPTNNPIYYSLGAHDSFAISETLDNYYAVFEKDESFDCWDANMSTQTNLGFGTKLDLNSPFLDNSGSIILSDINSRKVELRHKGDDKLVAEITFPEFSVLLFWHPIDSKMVCIEPWINMPDSKEAALQEFKDKKNIIKLNGKESKTLNRTISYYE